MWAVGDGVDSLSLSSVGVAELAVAAEWPRVCIYYSVLGDLSGNPLDGETVILRSESSIATSLVVRTMRSGGA